MPINIISVDSNAGVRASKPGGALRTSDFAEWVLRVHGRLHIREIMRHMREEGWQGNRDENKAEKTLFNVMASPKDRFENLGKDLWELTNKKK